MDTIQEFPESSSQKTGSNKIQMLYLVWPSHVA